MPGTRTPGRAHRRKTVVLGGYFPQLDWLYLWVWRLAVLLRTGEIKDLRLGLKESEASRPNADALCAAWDAEAKRAGAASQPASLLRALRTVFGVAYALMGIWKLLWAAFTWLGAYYFLKQSIMWMSNNAVPGGPPNTSDLTAGHGYAIALLLCGLLSSISIHQLYGSCSRMEIRVRSALCALVFRKSLVLARIRGGAGEVMNLVSADVTRVCEALTNFHFLWSAFIEVVLILVLVAVEIQQAFVPALLLVLVLLPVQWYLGSLTSKLQLEGSNVTTERVHLVSEMLTAIKLIKFYAWEVPFSERINEIRAREMALQRRNMVAKSINFAIVFAIPVLAAILCLSWYSANLGGAGPSATTVFTVLSLLNTLRYPFLMLPMAVTSSGGARIALRRIGAFLQQNELTPLLPSAAPAEDSSLAFAIEDADFTWEGDEKPTLDGITLSLKRGQILAVVGDVGSGKSTLVAALLGQAKRTRGAIRVHGSTAYVPQEAWLLNCSLRDNVLFGSSFERARYDEVVHVCALQRDLTLLAAGDETEIGERGSNLSGGQKQRVSLARAVYNNSDLVLLDDPLSAVDQNVGRHIFEKCIKSYLQRRLNKAIVLVTHQLQYLEQVDMVAVVKDGRIASYGSYADLYANNTAFRTMIENHVASGEDGDAEGSDDGDNEAGEYTSGEDGSPTAAEPDSEEGVHVALLGSSEGGEALPMIEIHRNMAANALTVPASGANGVRIGGRALQGGSGAAARRHIDLNQLSVTERNHLTVRSLRYVRSLNETQLSTLAERHQLDVVTGTHTTHDVARAIQRNELSVYSTQQEGGSLAEIARELALARRRDELDAAGASGESEVKSEQGKDAATAFPPQAPQPATTQPSHKLIQEDTSAERIGFRNVLEWARTGHGTLITSLIAAYFFFVHGVRIASDYWLRLWVPNSLNTSTNVYLGVYGAFLVIFAIGVLTRGLWFSFESVTKATELHSGMFSRIMRAPQAFFDTTPLARILSAFSKHQFTVDGVMPDNLMQALQYLPLALGAMILIAAIVPWNWIPVVGTVVVMALFVWFSAPAEKKLKQLEAITKPPVFSHLTATLEGLFSIRAYHAEQRFDTMNLARLDDNHEALYAMYMTKSWVALNIDLLTSLMIYFCALLLVVYRDSVNDAASTTGLALSNALQMLVFVQWTVRMLGDVNAQMSSVGQVAYYGSDAVAQEAPARIEATRPPATWPDRGEIEFSSVVLRYQSFGVNVLKHVSFRIGAREKIGIVGRTGSGKSTLLISLLRIVEAAEGRITIDGVDTRTLGLEDLRTRIAIIPQEPVLFVGTIRSNLDPFGRVSDDDIWRALEAVHLADRIRSYPSRLETAVIENGKNFSMGQRQLFCIARAILSKTRILVLDEASSALDMETDQLIQDTIKTVFKDLTVLTIAHRLNTIIEADKVLLMDGGKVLEFDEPLALLDKPDSSFRALVDQTGPAASRKLYDLARAAHQERLGG